MLLELSSFRDVQGYSSLVLMTGQRPSTATRDLFMFLQEKEKGELILKEQTEVFYIPDF